MIRFISFLLGKKYEPCRSCDVLKEQLEYERLNNAELMKTILNIVKPQVVEQPPIQEIAPVAQSSMLWSKKRAILEAKSREDAKILNEGNHLGKPDDPFMQQIKYTPSTENKEYMKAREETNNQIDKLEEELGVSNEN